MDTHPLPPLALTCLMLLVSLPAPSPAGASAEEGADRPILWGGPEGLERLRERAEDTAPIWPGSSWSFARMAGIVVDRAERIADLDSFTTSQGITVPLPPPEPACDTSRPTWTKITSKLRGYLHILTTAHLITGQDRYADRAAEIALAAADWSTWHCPVWTAHAGLDTSFATQGVAMAYDRLHDHLDAPERATLADALLDKGILPATKELTRGRFQRPDVHVPNGFAIVTAGLTAGAVVLAPDHPTAMAPHLAFAENRTAWFLDAGIQPDGGLIEGNSYGAASLNNLLPYALALHRFTGNDVLDHAHLRQVPAFVAALTTPGNEMANFGDNPKRANWDPTAQIVGSRLGSGLAHHLVEREGPWGNLPLALMVLEPSVELAPEDWWPPSRVFKETGWASLRTGFGEEDPMLALRAGPSLHHSHPDQGSFIVTHGRDWLVGDPGYARRGTPAYPFQAGTVGHNTLLLDGQDQVTTSQASLARKLVAPGLTAVHADLSAAYGGEMTSHRRVLQLDTDTPTARYLVLDEATTRTSREVAWLLHPDKEARAAFGPDGMVVANGDARLVARVLNPEGTTGPATYPGADAYGPYLEHVQEGPTVRVAALLKAGSAGDVVPGQASHGRTAAGSDVVRVDGPDGHETRIVARSLCEGFDGTWPPGWRYRVPVHAPGSSLAVAKLSLGDRARTDGADVRVTDAEMREVPTQVLDHDPAGVTKVLFVPNGTGKHFVFFGNPSAVTPCTPGGITWDGRHLSNGALRLDFTGNDPARVAVHYDSAWRDLGLLPGKQFLRTANGQGLANDRGGERLIVEVLGPLYARVRHVAEDRPVTFVNTYELYAGDDRLRVTTELRGLAGERFDFGILSYLAWGSSNAGILGTRGLDGYRVGHASDAAERPWSPMKRAYQQADEVIAIRSTQTDLGTVIRYDVGDRLPDHAYWSLASETLDRKGVIFEGPLRLDDGPTRMDEDLEVTSLYRFRAIPGDATDAARKHAELGFEGGPPAPAAGPAETRVQAPVPPVGLIGDGSLWTLSSKHGTPVAYGFVNGRCLIEDGLAHLTYEPTAPFDLPPGELDSGLEAVASAALRSTGPTHWDGRVAASEPGNLTVAVPGVVRNVTSQGDAVPWTPLPGGARVHVGSGTTDLRIHVEATPAAPLPLDPVPMSPSRPPAPLHACLATAEQAPAPGGR